MADLITETSNRATDQARALEKPLIHLDTEERSELLYLVERLIKWKK